MQGRNGPATPLLTHDSAISGPTQIVSPLGDPIHRRSVLPPRSLAYARFASSMTAAAISARSAPCIDLLIINPVTALIAGFVLPPGMWAFYVAAGWLIVRWGIPWSCREPRPFIINLERDPQALRFSHGWTSSAPVKSRVTCDIHACHLLRKPHFQPPWRESSLSRLPG